MKIAFRLDANKNIGIGHAMRCSSLAKAFSEKGYSISFFCHDDSVITSFTKSRNIPLYIVPEMPLTSEIDWLNSTFTDHGGYDIVITDTYWLSDNYINALNSIVKNVVCIDDYALYIYNCAIVINANIYAHELNFKFGRKRPKLLLGGQYVLLRDEFKNIPPIKVQENAKRVFIGFGGCDVNQYTAKAVNSLRNIVGIELNVVMGAETQNDKIQSIENTNVSIYKNPVSIANVMSQCDIAIAAGGTMVYELAALGIPTIIISQADNQLHFADFISRTGLMEYAGHYDEVNLSKLKESVERLLNDTNRRQKESIALSKSVSVDGTQRVMNEIIRFAEGVCA